MNLSSVGQVPESSFFVRLKGWYSNQELWSHSGLLVWGRPMLIEQSLLWSMCTPPSGVNSPSSCTSLFSSSWTVEHKFEKEFFKWYQVKTCSLKGSFSIIFLLGSPTWFVPWHVKCLLTDTYSSLQRNLGVTVKVSCYCCWIPALCFGKTIVGLSQMLLCLKKPKNQNQSVFWAKADSVKQSDRQAAYLMDGLDWVILEL